MITILSSNRPARPESYPGKHKHYAHMGVWSRDMSRAEP